MGMYQNAVIEEQHFTPKRPSRVGVFGGILIAVFVIFGVASSLASYLVFDAALSSEVPEKSSATIQWIVLGIISVVIVFFAWRLGVKWDRKNDPKLLNNAMNHATVTAVDAEVNPPAGNLDRFTRIPGSVWWISAVAAVIVVAGLSSPVFTGKLKDGLSSSDVFAGIASYRTGPVIGFFLTALAAHYWLRLVKTTRGRVVAVLTHVLVVGVATLLFYVTGQMISVVLTDGDSVGMEFVVMAEALFTLLFVGTAFVTAVVLGAFDYQISRRKMFVKGVAETHMLAGSTHRGVPLARK